MTKSEIVIRNNAAYHLVLGKGQLARNVLIAGDPARAAKIAEHFDAVDHRIANREFVTYTGIRSGMPISVIGTGIGTDNVEIALAEAYVINEFDFETGVRLGNIAPMTIIRIGTSGGIRQDVEPGTLAIASYALGLDSTGPYYDFPAADPIVERIEQEAARLIDESIAPDSRFKGRLLTYASKASADVVDALNRHALAEGAAVRTGITVSAPGFYGPSSRNIAGITNTVPDIKASLAKIDIDGLVALNMEMESSLMFHFCRGIGYRCGTICPIISAPHRSDALLDYDSVIDQAITIGLNAIAELSADR